MAFSELKDKSKSLECIKESNAIAENTHIKKGKARALYINGLVESELSNFGDVYRIVIFCADLENLH